MPLPTPTTSESKDDFISRCMADSTSVADFPDSAQRMAVCQRQWDEGKAKATWYAKEADKISIFDEIGGWGVSSKEFIAALNEMDGDLTISVNSPGGDVLEGLAIYNAIKSYSGNVTIEVNTLAASMASVIALAGDKIKIADNGFFMIHNPWTVAGGDADYLEKTASDMRKMQGVLENIYFENTNLTLDQVKEMMAAETWIAADEAIEMGLADEVFKAEKPKAEAKHFRGQIAARIFNGVRAPTSKPANRTNNRGDKTMSDNDKLLDMQAKLTDAEASTKSLNKEIADLKAQLKATETERSKAIENVRKDAAAIIALGTAHGQVELAVDAISGEVTVEEFKSQLLEAYANWQEDADDDEGVSADLDPNREPATRAEFLETYNSLSGREKSDYFGKYSKTFLK